jgi:hypothetical protein
VILRRFMNNLPSKRLRYDQQSGAYILRLERLSTRAPYRADPVTQPKRLLREGRLGNKGRSEYLRAIFDRYQKAGRKSKKVILSEFCANTGYNRKYAIRLLNGPRPEKVGKPPRRRGVSYNQETLAVLTAVWESAGYPWSVPPICPRG